MFSPCSLLLSDCSFNLSWAATGTGGLSLSVGWSFQFPTWIQPLVLLTVGARLLNAGSWAVGFPQVIPLLTTQVADPIVPHTLHTSKPRLTSLHLFRGLPLSKVSQCQGWSWNPGVSDSRVKTRGSPYLLRCFGSLETLSLG